MRIPFHSDFNSYDDHMHVCADADEEDERGSMVVLGQTSGVVKAELILSMV